MNVVAQLVNAALDLAVLRRALRYCLYRNITHARAALRCRRKSFQLLISSN